MKYEVLIMRVIEQNATVEVEASSEEAAKVAALAQVKDDDWELEDENDEFEVMELE